MENTLLAASRLFEIISGQIVLSVSQCTSFSVYSPIDYLGGFITKVLIEAVQPYSPI